MNWKFLRSNFEAFTRAFRSQEILVQSFMEKASNLSFSQKSSEFKLQSKKLRIQALIKKAPNSSFNQESSEFKL